MEEVPLWRGEVLQGQELAAFDADERFARFVFTRAGLELVESVAQRWSLSEQGIELVVARSEKGHWRALLAGHEAPAPLPVLYAAAVSGEFRWLRRAELPRWKRRALLEAGLVGVPPVALATLSDDLQASEPARAVWAAIELLVHVRVLGGERPQDALPLSRPFLRHWTPASEWTVRAGMEALERQGLIWRAGTYAKSGGSRPLTLWRVALR